MHHRRYLLTVAGVGTLAGCSDGNADAETPSNSTGTTTPSTTERPLDDAEIAIERFQYPNAPEDYEADVPGTVLQNRVVVNVVVDVPVAADGAYDATVTLDLESADGEIVTTDTQEFSGRANTEDSIQLFRSFEFDAGPFDYATYMASATATDAQNDTTADHSADFELLHPQWDSRAEVRSFMQDAKDILQDALDIFHGVGDGDWLNVTADADAGGAMDNVQRRAFNAQPVEVDALETAYDRGTDDETWEKRIQHVTDERELISTFANKRKNLFKSYNEAFSMFEELEAGDSVSFHISDPALEDDLEAFEPWGDPLAEYWPKLEQMEADVDQLEGLVDAADRVDSGLDRLELANDYMQKKRYSDARSESISAVDDFEAALDTIADLDGFEDLERSCQRDVEPLLEQARETRDEAANKA